MKIWVTGATGLLGSRVSLRARERKHQVVEIGFSRYNGESVPDGVQRRQLDLRDEAAVTRQLLEDFPDAIVNAAAATENRSCLADQESARILNVNLPAWLGRLSHHLSARFIQVSTEQVFDGQIGDGRSYEPSDQPNPLNLYGRLKLEGERAALEHGKDFTAVVRIPLLQGNSPSGLRSLHERLFMLWSKGEKPRMFTDQYRQTCTAENAAEAIVELCEKPRLTGVFHWAGQDCLSRLELGLAIARHFKIPEDWIIPAQMSGDPNFADQPLRLPLHTGKLQRELRTRPESLPEQLDKLVVPPPFRQWFHELPALD
jgi:dTDP-4-dehydrorhamnose reductase